MGGDVHNTVEKYPGEFKYAHCGTQRLNAFGFVLREDVALSFASVFVKIRIDNIYSREHVFPSRCECVLCVTLL